LLAKRIETYFGRSIDEAEIDHMNQPSIALFLNSVMQPRFYGRGKWRDIPTYRMLMSLIRKRPRDLVKLCTLAARRACEDKSRLIGTQHFIAVFEEYSQGRVQDTINEYKSELPDIERLVMNMKPSRRLRTTEQSYFFGTDQLLRKLDSVLQTGQFRFADGSKAEKKSLAHFLFKINFLTARKDLPDGEIQRTYFEENRYLSNKFVDFGWSWEIHPAYRWALQPNSLNQILDGLDLAQD
jgi:hypothetical protein